MPDQQVRSAGLHKVADSLDSEPSTAEDLLTECDGVASRFKKIADSSAASVLRLELQFDLLSTQPRAVGRAHETHPVPAHHRQQDLCQVAVGQLLAGCAA